MFVQDRVDLGSTSCIFTRCVCRTHAPSTHDASQALAAPACMQCPPSKVRNLVPKNNIKIYYTTNSTSTIWLNSSCTILYGGTCTYTDSDDTALRTNAQHANCRRSGSPVDKCFDPESLQMA